jgi:hypothetical protein
MTTKKLQDILERVATWPAALQDEAADRLRALESEHQNGDLSPEDRDALERSADDVRQGKFASDADVAELFSRFRQR